MAELNKTDLFVYDKEAWLNVTNRNNILSDPAKIHTYHNSIVLPLRVMRGTSVIYGDGLLEGGVCDDNFNFLAGQHRSYTCKNTNRSCVASYEVDRDMIEFRDETVIFGGILTSHFGHTLYDSTSRLWYPAMHCASEHKVVFVVYPGQKFPYYDLLRLAGIDKDRVEIIERPTRFAEIIVPDETCFSLPDCYCTKEWILLFDVIRDNTVASRHKKIYLSRTAFGISNCVGEEYYEEYYRRQGFLVVSPEKLPLEEQVSLLAGANEVVATMGTIAALILFSQKGTKLTVLNRSTELVECVVMASQAREAQVTYIDIHKNFLPEVQGGNSIFLLSPNRCWEEYLESKGQTSQQYEEIETPFEKLSYDYVTKWGEFYSQPKPYRWIKNFDLINVVDRMNKYLFNNQIEISEYPPPRRISALERSLESLRLEKSALALEQCKTEVRTENVGYRLSGSFSIPFADPSTLSFSLCAREVSGSGTAHEKTLKVEPFTISYSDKTRLFVWEATLNLNSLYETITSFIIDEPDTFDFNDWNLYLRIANPSEKKELRLNAITYDKMAEVYYREHERHNKLFHLTSDSIGNLVLAFSDPGYMLPEHTDYKIKSMGWINDSELLLSGIISHKIIQSPSVELDLLVCEYQNEENCCRFSAQLLPDSNCNSQSDWTATVNEPAFLDFLSSTAQNEKRWDFYLQISTPLHSKLVRIGAKRNPGQYLHYSQKIITSGQYLIIPSETGKQNLSFDQLQHNTALRRVKKYWIERVEWSEDTLQLCGWIKTPLVHMKDFAIDLCLDAYQNEDRFSISFPTKVSVEEGEINRSNWMVSVPLSDLAEYIANKNIGFCRWDMYLCLRLGEQTSKIRIGAKRKKGSLKAFQECTYKNRRLMLVPTQTTYENLSFEARSINSKKRKPVKKLVKYIKGHK